MPDPKSYAEFDTLLMRGENRVPSRKIANNTYAQRRNACCVINRANPTCIAVMFHDTDILTFHWTDTISLDSGGWITQVTKERMNRYLPEGLYVTSHKGRWMLTNTRQDVPGGANSHPYVDKMCLAPVHGLKGRYAVAGGLPDAELKRQDAHNRRVEKLIDTYLRAVTADDYLDNDETGCGMCVRTGVGVLIGDSFEDKQHLIEHLIDKCLPKTVWHVACDHGYGGGDGIYRCQHFDIAKRDLRKYLRQQLYVGPVAIKGGKRPAHTPPWSLTAQLTRGKSA
jgi:hypothetical protein